MKREYETELKHISRLSTVLVAFFWLALGLIAVAMLHAGINILGQPTSDGEHQIVALRGIELPMQEILQGELTARDKLVVMLVFAAAFAFAVPFLLLTIKLLGCFRRQELFSEQSVRYARAIAWLYSVYIVLGLLAIPVLPAVLGVAWTTGFSTSPIIILALLWMYAWIMQVGRALQFDSDLAI